MATGTKLEKYARLRCRKTPSTTHQAAGTTGEKEAISNISTEDFSGTDDNALWCFLTRVKGSNSEKFVFKVGF